MWLTKLKVAIVEKNTNTINTLLDEIPSFEEIKDIEQALYLLKEASTLLYGLRDETVLSMSQIKKNIDFLRSTQPAKKNTLDISS